jgi:hypothetical protein
MDDKTIPAFPTERIGMESGEVLTYQEEGMALRDYFAAKALPTAVNINVKQYTWEFGSEWYWNDEEDAAFAASVAYQLADAMMKERLK